MGKIATERLRELLDERGVEWREPDSILRRSQTLWDVDGVTWTAIERRDGFLRVESKTRYYTPEQAIASTLRVVLHRITPEKAIAATLLDERGFEYFDESETRWHELFGTPEKVARFMVEHCNFRNCAECPLCHDDKGATCEIPGNCVWGVEDDSYGALLAWLRGKAVE